MAENLGALTLKLEAQTDEFKVALSSARNALAQTGTSFDNLDVKASNQKGLRLAAGSLRTLSALSMGLNLAALSDGLGEGVRKGAQFAAVLSGIAEASVHASEGFLAIRSVIGTFLIPAAAAAASITSMVAGLVGAAKLLRGELTLDPSATIMSQFVAVYKAGFEAIKDAGAAMKEKIAGQDWSDVNLHDAFELETERLNTAAEAAKKRLEATRKRVEEFYSEWGGVENMMLGTLADFQSAVNAGVSMDFNRPENNFADSGPVTMDVSVGLSETEKGINYIDKLLAQRLNDIDVGAAKFEADARVVDAQNIWGGAVDILAGAVASSAPKVSGIMEGAAQGFASGGIWGALLGAIMKIFTMTKAFSSIMESIEGLVTPILEIVDVIFEPIAEIFAVFSEIGESSIKMLKPLFIIITAVVKALNLLSPIMDLLNWVIKQIEEMIQSMIKGLIKFFKDLPKWIRPPGVVKALENSLSKEAVEDVADGMNDLGGGLDAANKGLDAFTGELNAPDGLKLSLRRLGAMTAEQAPLSNMSTPWVTSSDGNKAIGDMSNGNVVVQNMNIVQPVNYEAIISEIFNRTQKVQAAASGAAPAGVNSFSSAVSTAISGAVNARADYYNSVRSFMGVTI